MKTFKWCRSNGCEWDWRVCFEAAKGGQLETLQWCRSNGCEWNVRTCQAAAARGQLETLKWCRSNGCEWDVGACFAAAQGGHLETFQWAIASGCAWDRAECLRPCAGPEFTATLWSGSNPLIPDGLFVSIAAPRRFYTSPTGAFSNLCLSDERGAGMRSEVSHQRRGETHDLCTLSLLSENSLCTRKWKKYRVQYGRVHAPR